MYVRHVRNAIGGTPILIAAATLVLASWLPRARAQDLEESVEEQVQPKAAFLGEAGFTYQGETDINGGGTMQVNRYNGAVASQTDLLKELRWTNTFFFGADDYDFDGGGFSTGKPWQTILAMRLGTKLAYRLNEQWGIWAGGVLIFSPETGADWGKSVTGGGRLGFDYRHSETLFASLGVAVITQLEDSPKVVPSVGLNWLPHEQWAVRVGAIPVSGGAAAAGEVAYQIIEPLTVGLGVIYQQRRFRLDNSGIAPNGVGEENSLPVRLRLGWNINQYISLHLVGGVALAGDLQLDNQNGNQLRSHDYDPAPYFGVHVLGAL